MTIPRWAFCALPVALAAAGCSAPGTGSTASGPSSAAQSPSASPTPTTPFCLDLDTFQIGVIMYRSDVAKAAEGEGPGLKEMKRKAKLILYYAEAMKASVPPDITDDFQSVVKAIETSAENLEPGAKVVDVFTPVYNEKNKAAFKAVQNYECAPGGG